MYFLMICVDFSISFLSIFVGPRLIALPKPPNTCCQQFKKTSPENGGIYYIYNHQTWWFHEISMRFWCGFVTYFPVIKHGLLEIFHWLPWFSNSISTVFPASHVGLPEGTGLDNGHNPNTFFMAKTQRNPYFSCSNIFSEFSMFHHFSGSLHHTPTFCWTIASC